MFDSNANRLKTYFYYLSKYIVSWKTKLSGHIKSFSIHFMYFQCHYGSFTNFWRIIYCCINNGPLPNVIFSALYFKHSLLNWRLKCMEMTECLLNCRFYQTIISNFSSKLKLKLIEKLLILDDFYAPDLRWENVIILGCAAWSYHYLQKRW
mgnify:CR=1 FL=1